MKKQVFIINGSGGTGKDTFVELVHDSDNFYRLIAGKYIKRVKVYNYSSVTKVKKIAKLIGWNGEKTEKDRKFLSDLKLLTSEYNDMPLEDMKSYANKVFNSDFDRCDIKILFLHIREPEEISKAVNEFKKYNAKTILVKRDSIKHITSNMADGNVYNYDYDIVINNNGTLDDLKVKAECFLMDFETNGLKNEY